MLDSTDSNCAERREGQSSECESDSLGFQCESKGIAPCQRLGLFDWKQVRGLLIRSLSDCSSERASEKVAGFDLDGTLVVPKSGDQYPQSRTDWKWLFSCIPTALQRLHEEGYKIVIFSNQAGVSRNKQSPDDLKGKIDDICADLNQLPIYAFFATDMDHWRKPSAAMWYAMIEKANRGVVPELAKCFYVGDSSGRPARESRRKDLSAVDRKMADNIGIRFYTPEEYFLNEPAGEFDWETAHPSTFLEGQGSVQSMDQVTTELKVPLLESIGRGQEMVIMVGWPASGKSHFCKNYLEPAGYVIIDANESKTRENCIRRARDVIRAGKSVVIDGANPSVSERRAYIDLARKCDKCMKVRIFHMQASLELSKHCNVFRNHLSESSVPRVPNAAYSMFRSRYEEPQMREGVFDVCRIPWRARFGDQAHRDQFLKWTQ